MNQIIHTQVSGHDLPSLLPACAGEVVFNIISRLSLLFKVSDLSQKIISDNLNSLLRSLTSSSYSSVFFPRNSFLHSDTQDPVPINASSFHGLIAKSKIPQIVNQANKSSLLKSFEDSHWPAHLPWTSLNNICAVPVLSDSQDLFAVIFLYNKQEASKVRLDFSLNDVFLVQSAGKLVQEVVSMQARLQSTQEELSQSLKLFKETNFLYSTASLLMRREKCFKYLLKNTKTVNSKTLELLAVTLHASAALMHVKQGPEYLPVLSYGLSSSAVHLTKTCEYTGNTVKDAWISYDLKSEPLWNSRLIDYRSLLSCPVVSSEGTVMAVVEFLRLENCFSEHDKNVAKELASVMAKVKYKTFLALIQASENNAKDEKNCISLKEQMLVDSETLIDRVRNSVSLMVPNESCSFFVVNHVRNENWTISSGYVQKNQTSEDSLVGYLCANKKSLNLEPGSQLAVKELKNYKNKHLMVVPVLNNAFDPPVIGSLLLCRSKLFTSKDLKMIEQLSLVLSLVLEALCVVSSSSSNSQVFNLTAETVPEHKPESSIAAKSSQPVHFLCQLDSLSHENLLKLSEMRKILENAEAGNSDALLGFASQVSRIMNCKAGGLLLKNLTEDYFIYLPKGTLIGLGGIIQQCFLKNSTICVKRSPEDVPEFDPRIDSLELGDSICNILCVPVPGFKSEVLAVICLLNSLTEFNIQDVVLVQYFALIVRELISASQSEADSKQLMLNETRKNTILLRWFKQVFIVSNSLKHKHELSKEVYQKVLANASLETLLSCLLQITKAITNSEDVFALFLNSALVKYSAEQSPSSSALSGDMLEYIQAECLQTLSKPASHDKENQLVCPYSKAPNKLVLVLSNKKDETLSYFCSYSRADESLASELASIIHSALTQGSTLPLKSAIKRFAAGMNTTSLINTIRSAAQQLLECERGTVFIREDDFLVVKAQGIEHELPVGIKVPINKGIVGFVAQTGQSENIEDVYQDPRFNQEIDMMTGFRTRSMLCLPVFNANNQVIAALQMINKRNGVFTKNDEENLELFSQMASSVLQNWMMMEKIIEERGVYLNILNSIGNFVMVINSEGKLQYFNKEFKDVFGFPESSARNSHYSAWLRFNRQLVIDVTKVFQSPESKIVRAGQRIVTQDVPRILKDFRFVEGSKVFNYVITTLNDSFSAGSSGIIVVMEDASAYQELNIKFNAIQNQLIQLTNPVQTETSLQRCINRLSVIQESFEQGSGVFGQIQEIIDTLRKGNLTKTEVLIPIELKSMEMQLKSRLSLYVEDSQRYPRFLDKPELTGRRLSQDSLLGLTELTLLQNWTLDPFEIEDHFRYIEIMFQEFNLCADFSISPSVMMNFLVKVRNNYMNNPFHNFYHGFTVLHSAFYLLTLKKINEIFNKQEIFAILVAALCHDLGHRGFTNLYEVNSMSDLAILYNDISVLESHHTALTFKLTSEADSNIFLNTSREMTKYMRKIIIECILSTDMVKHFPIIGSHTDRFKQIHKFPVGSLEKDCEHLSGFIVHCCDIGHPTKSLDLYSKFSKLVCEEFSNQYLMEIQNSLPLTEFMKGLDQPLNYYINEVGFLSVIVKPLWECFYLWAEEAIEECMKNLNSNLLTYQMKKEAAMKQSRT